MKYFLILCFVMMGCNAGMDTDREVYTENCQQIAMDLAESTEGLRTVSHDPSPESVDEVIRLGREYSENCARSQTES